mgnify:CR=1 FL=1
MVDIEFLPEVRVLVDKHGNIVAYHLGGTRFPVFRGQAEADVFYRAVVPSLKMRAERLGIELKEAHVHDDILETIVHESLHVALDKIDVPGTPSEEAIVDQISKDVLAEIREVPQIPTEPERARKMRAAYLRKELREVPVRNHWRRSP